MTKCNDCHSDCHCSEELHSHHYDGDLCTCENCKCKSKAEDKSYEDDLMNFSSGIVLVIILLSLLMIF